MCVLVQAWTMQVYIYLHTDMPQTCTKLLYEKTGPALNFCFFTKPFQYHSPVLELQRY